MYIHQESEHNLKSPSIVVPIISELLVFNSVLDVGCGIGTWLHEFEKHGVKDVMGVDGDYVDIKLLNKYLDSSNFKTFDLQEAFNLDRKFDLAISLEVAEHLCEASAHTFIHSLCRHSDTIVFSAAIPGQGGQNHINEQWPSFWVDIFQENGFEVYDPLRSRLWDLTDVDLWYKQNILVYSKLNLDLPKPNILDVVHPEYFQHRNKMLSTSELRYQKILAGKAGLGFSLNTLKKSVLNVFS